MQRRAIPSIVFAELLGTSLWFSANATATDLGRAGGWTASEVGWSTAAVQIGFIVGTLVVAATGLADRWPTSRVFAFACVAGALANAAFVAVADQPGAVLALRCAVGVALAGIYPLGMKLVVGWDPARAGGSLGWLVGMLTLGTALPHGVRAFGAAWPWQTVVLVSSALALVAAVLVVTLGDGPGTTARTRLRPLAPLAVFRIPAFRASAGGYFGHMWELYAFWTLVPLLVARALVMPAARDVSALSFGIVALGAVGCIGGGFVARRTGSARVAAWALGVSGGICLVFPFSDGWPTGVRLALLGVWGVAVVADSPQFSALSAAACPPGSIGTALTLQNCIGFLIATVSIIVTTAVFATIGDRVAWILLPGPLLGLFAMRRLLVSEPASATLIEGSA